MSTIQVPSGTQIQLRQGPSTTVQWSIDNSTWTTITFPCTIVNQQPLSDAVIVSFPASTALLLNTPQSYFIAGSAGIQFGQQTTNADGSRPLIRIAAVTDYPGLVQNGSNGVNGYANVSILNLVLTITGGSTLVSNGGWFAQAYYSYGVTANTVRIVNCASLSAPISNSSGGIVGSYAAGAAGQLTLLGCISTGTIGTSAGGMVGILGAAAEFSLITAERCASFGMIGTNAGGIFGNSCGVARGTVQAIGCYSTGTILGSGGGIFGITCSQAGLATATNCYSIGSISSGAGGIFGPNAGTTFNGVTGRAQADNCYASGNIGTSAGGIYGPSYNPVTCSAYHCYTARALSSGAGGIWAGSTSDTVNGVANYAEGNHSGTSWTDSNAQATLTGIHTVWIQPNGLQTPYQLFTSGYSPYSTALTNTVAATVYVGQATPAALSNSGGMLYTFLFSPSNVTIDSMSGAITPTVAGTLTLSVYSYLAYGNYQVTVYTLTVQELPSVSQTISSNLPYPVPQTADWDTSRIVKQSTGRILRNGVTQRQLGVAAQVRTAYSQPTFPSYGAYMMYLQSGRGL